MAITDHTYQNAAVNPLRQFMADAETVTDISPYLTFGTDHATVQWQDTTSNATYSSASAALSVT